MKILIDTNILLDVLVKREPHYLDAAKLWTLIKERILVGYISAISVNNLYYIVNKLRSRAVAESFVDELLLSFEIIPLTKDILLQARSKDKRDYEDLIQFFSAIHAGCEFIITRNKKDYPRVGVKIFSTQEFLKLIRTKST